MPKKADLISELDWITNKISSQVWTLNLGTLGTTWSLLIAERFSIRNKITTQIVSHRDYSRRFAFRTSPPVLRFSFCRPLNIASTRTGLAIALNPVVPTMRNRDGPGIDCV
jgi:hypothetical protein